jgi:AraC-like DNA-binding protein
MLALVTRGSAELQLSRRAFGLGAGAFYTRSDERHAVRAGSQGAELVVLDLDTEPAGPSLLRSARLREIARRLDSAIAARTQSVEVIALEAVSALGAVGQKAPAWLGFVEGMLDRHFDQPLNLTDLARLANVHPMQVARVFRGVHGESVFASLRRRRVLRAAERIASSDVPLSAIALEAGFYDQAHFCRVFRKIMGRTPGSLRR